MTLHGHAVGWRQIVGGILVAAALAGGSVAILHKYLDSSSDTDQDQTEGIVDAPLRVSIKDGVVVLTLSAADQQNAGIGTIHPPTAPAQSTIVGYGTVLDAAALTELSNRYLDAESGVQTAEAKLAVSRAAFERAKVLHRDRQNISTAQLQDAEESFAVDREALAAARARLATVAATARQDWGNVIGAAVIDHAPLIADLIDRRGYLVKVTLPSGTVTAPPESASVVMSGGPGTQLGFISPATSTDPRFQGVSYFYKAPAESGLLPGSHVEVALTIKAAGGGLLVPEGAIVWLQGKAWIYLRIGETSFERREIITDRPAPEGGYVVAGLPADARIVVRGAQMLLSEEFRAQAPIED